MKTPIVVASVFAVLLSSCGAESAPSDSLVDVGGHSLELHVEGEGSPAVVIDAGLGDTMGNWRTLQQFIAHEVQVIAYNRAGYGRSEAGQTPRDAAREADELRRLLDSASARGPFVLVGHSLGALNVQVFASRYPDEVAGMVLLDPPPLTFILGQEYKDLGALAERMTAEWQAASEALEQSSNPEYKTQGAFLRMIASEHREMFSASAEQVSAIASFGDIPLIVIASGEPNPAFGPVADEYQKYWIEQSRQVSLKSTKGEFVLAPESSHRLYADASDTVLSAILSVVHELKKK